jgi:hypothetical protein
LQKLRIATTVWVSGSWNLTLDGDRAARALVAGGDVERVQPIDIVGRAPVFGSMTGVLVIPISGIMSVTVGLTP